jgi:hypothetical protein
MLSDSLADTAIDRLQMRFRSRGADHKKIGKRRDSSQVEYHDIFGLLILGYFNAKTC